MTLIRASQFFAAVCFIFLTLNSDVIFGKHAQSSYSGLNPKQQGPECCDNSTCFDCFLCMNDWGCGLITDAPATYEPCPTSPPCECVSCPTPPPFTDSTEPTEPPVTCPTTPRPTCPPCPTCPPSVTCPSYPPCTTAEPPVTDSPPPSSSPKFSQAIYQSSLPSWPTAGTNVHLGLNASTEDGSPVRYQLLTSFEFLTLSATNDIIFTSNVSDGAYVGPNNVMIIEVVASVIGDESRAGSAVIVIIFPRSTTTNDENSTIL